MLCMPEQDMERHSSTLANYNIGTTIHTGPSWKVKTATNSFTAEKVAIKIIRRDQMMSARMEDKVNQEIKILRSFTCSNVVKFYEVIETSEAVYIATEYCENGELFDYIVSKGRLQEDEARRIFQQIICGVEYCHRNMVVHCDLRPENLLLDSEFNVKLANFEYSNVMQDGKFLNTNGGSTNYAAPERQSEFTALEAEERNRSRKPRERDRKSDKAMGTYKCCLIFKRRFHWSDAPPPDDVRVLFAQHAGAGPHMDADGLRRYLDATGHDDADVDVHRLLDQIRHGRTRVPGVGRQLITLDDFHRRFLFNHDLNPPTRQAQVHHDMTAPLSHYFIYTGHNSYLTGNQLSSDCSDIPIIKALQRGVRVIELDMWPNSTKDDINILHGRTLTTPVSLMKCLRSIKEYAFVASQYPVIITLEDHLPPDLQDKVAKMVLQVFGDMLYYPDTKHPKEFPSPEDLKGRVLLSTKPPKEYLETKEGGTMKEADAELHLGQGAGDDVAWGNEVPDIQTEIQSANKHDDDASEHQKDDGEEEVEEEERKTQHLALQYKHLITIRAGKPKGAIVDALKSDPDKVRRLSLSEHELAKVAAHHGTDIVRFTQRNLLRIYPKGTRVTSSNYNPFLGWVHGAQMVAFNMQGYGRALWLMHGFYKANGGCGYVKKPDFLMQTEPDVFDPKEPQPVKKTLKVTVYMGDGWRMDFKHTHFDQYSPPDFYARVGIAGVPADSVMKKTKAIEDNWVPVWDEEFTFELTVPEIALLRVEVHEYDMSEKDDFGGQTVLPVSELRPGIRAVALYDRKGNKFNNVKLLMRFEFV